MKKHNPNNTPKAKKNLHDISNTNQNCLSTHRTIIEQCEETASKQTIDLQANNTVCTSKITISEKPCENSQRTMLEARPTQNFGDTFTNKKQQAQTREQSKQTSLPSIFADKYKIVGVLGSGAMGKVFEAIEIGKTKRYAIKVIHQNKEGSEEIVKRFYRESKLLEKLNHPNIIKIHEQGEFQGQPYFVMDLVKGCTFTEIIKRPSYPFKRKLIILIQVLEAIHNAHREGIIHRDLKPDNIMVTHEGKALVMDFGIARDQGDNQSTKLTKTGMLVGTPLYMSPEQINGEKTTVKSDIYTLGVIMYEVITGKVPFSGNLSKIMWQIAHSDPIHPREISDNVPKNLAKICLKAMIKEKEERYATARAMANDIKRYLKGQKISVNHTINIKKLLQNTQSFTIPLVILFLGVFWILSGGSTNVKNDVAHNQSAANQNRLTNLPEDQNDTKFNNSLPQEKKLNDENKNEKIDGILEKSNQKNLDNSLGVISKNPKKDLFSEEQPDENRLRNDRHQNNQKKDRFSKEQLDEKTNSSNHRPRNNKHKNNQKKDRFSEEQPDEKMNGRNHRPRNNKHKNNQKQDRFSGERPDREMNSHDHPPRNNRHNEDHFSEERSDQEMNSRDHPPRNDRHKNHYKEDHFSEEQPGREINNHDHHPRNDRHKNHYKEDHFSEERPDREMNHRDHHPRNDRHKNHHTQSDHRSNQKPLSQRKQVSNNDKMIGQHFRDCQECHELIRKNKIDLGGPPPNWSRIPKKIIKQIKKHAQNK